MKFPLWNVGVLARHVLCVKLDLGTAQKYFCLSFKILIEIPVYKVEGRVFGPPPSDVDKLESVIFGDELPLAGDVNVSEYILIVLGHVEDFDGDELLEVSDGGEGRHADKLSTQLRQLFRIRTLKHQVDLLIKPVSREVWEC